MNKRKSAFTLAEVLITLGIIGVVAAITIPVLMAKINEQVHKAQLKKVMSTLNQSLKMVYNNTDTIYDCYYNQDGSIEGTSINGCKDLDAEMRKVLKISHVCESNAYAEGCIPKYNGKDTVLKETYGDDYNLDNNNANCGGLNEDKILNRNTAIVLLDGTIIGYFSPNNPRYIYVDVNGNKGPNRWGYDIFMFILKGNPEKGVSYFPTNGGCNIVEKGGKSSFDMMYK